MNKIYYLHCGFTSELHAGNKAVSDAEMIFENLSIKKLNLFSPQFKRFKRIQNIYQISRLNTVPEGSVIIVQHPVYIHKDYLEILSKLKIKKRIKLVFLIHDLESFRNLLSDSYIYEEREKFIIKELADVLIVHNNKMKEELLLQYQGYNLENRIIILEIFDYLLDKREISVSRKISSQIVIAGNLSPEKSGYLYELSRHLLKTSLNLYGVNFNDKLIVHTSHVRYKGAFLPEVLPYELEGAFGVVWDGQEVTTCSGNTGNYLKFNNPHKLSLYIVSRLPIIIWREAAAAQFVIDHKIGIVVDDLTTIDKTISQISEKEYQLFVKNLEILSKKIGTGYYLRKSIHESLRLIEDLE